jgi:hypothetical protein
MAAMLLVLIASWCAPGAPVAQSQESETAASGIDKVRIEQEDKLLIPVDQIEEVWDYLRERLVEDDAFLAELDPAFTASWSEELFHDTYFDTPTLELYAMGSGVRHRHRVNLSDPDDRKSGRELMQIKVSSISDNELERGEIKFDIERPRRIESAADRHPLLGRVKPDHRAPFVRRLEALGLDPEKMRPILTVRDQRRRVYVLRGGLPFMSISHDRTSSRVWWGRSEFCELEPELNEIGFTDADPATRAYMESVLERVVADVRARFPRIERDLTPKYNKSFDRIEAELPFLRLLVRAGMQDQEVFYSLCLFASILAGAAYGALHARLRRRRRVRLGRPGVARAA